MRRLIAALTFAVLVVWSRAVALVTGAHVGAFEVGAGAVGADLRLQALIHILENVA